MDSGTTSQPDGDGSSDAAQTSTRLLSFRQAVHGDLLVWVKRYNPDALRSDGSFSAAAAVRLWINQCGLRAGILFRISNALWRSGVPLIPGMVSRLNLTLHGVDIPPSVRIGAGLFMPHPVGTVVFADEIGAEATLVAGVTIGLRGDPPAFPRLGDRVFVGAGARVLGGISIGDDAKIGANAVVLCDVPAGATALGVPARIRFPQPTTAALEEE